MAVKYGKRLLLRLNLKETTVYCAEKLFNNKTGQSVKLSMGIQQRNNTSHNKPKLSAKFAEKTLLHIFPKMWHTQFWDLETCQQQLQT